MSKISIQDTPWLPSPRVSCKVVLHELTHRFGLLKAWGSLLPESRSTAGMKRGHVWTVFVFALVVFVKMIASADVMTRGLDFQGKVLREGMEIDSEQEAALPDISDPAIRKELKCQLCQGVVMEMLQTIRGQEHELLRRLTEVEVVETLEKICSQVL